MRRSTLPWLFPLAVGLAAACSSSSTSGFGSMASDGGVDNGSDATSSGNGASAGDAGARCGAQACSTSEVCCYGTAMPTCMASGNCQGSFLSCSSQGDCSAGQSCCFVYGAAGGAGEAGPPAGRGGGAFGAPGGSFTAQCQDSCPMTAFRLCASNAECQTGETCGMGPYAGYCQVSRMNPFGDGGFRMNRFGDGGGFPIPPPGNATDQ